MSTHRNVKSDLWKQAGVETALLEFWAAGLSGQLTAKALKDRFGIYISRSSVIAKLHRMRELDRLAGVETAIAKRATKLRARAGEGDQRYKPVREHRRPKHEAPLRTVVEAAMQGVRRVPAVTLATGDGLLPVSQRCEPEPEAPRGEGVPFLKALPGQCRNPLWGDGRVPLEAKRICGAPAMPDESYCPACKAVLTFPAPMRTGRPVRYNSGSSKPVACDRILDEEAA